MSAMVEIIPARMVAEATERNAARIADQLVMLLTEPGMPEDMRVEIRARLADLYRRFPAAGAR